MTTPDKWFLPRAELEAMDCEWIPDTCPVLQSMIAEVVRDKTCPGLEVEK